MKTIKDLNNMNNEGVENVSVRSVVTFSRWGLPLPAFSQEVHSSRQSPHLAGPMPLTLLKISL